MKKLLILAGVIALCGAVQAFAAEQPVQTPESMPVKPVCGCPQQRMQRPPFDKAQFDKRMKLTDEQRENARLIREKGHEQMRPIMDGLKIKHEEIEAIRKSKLSSEAQEEQINHLRKEVQELNKQANDLRMENMKEFESILTKKQKKELKKMKKEGRKAFEKLHKKQMFWMLPPMGPGPECGLNPPLQEPPVEMMDI